ncbi:MAG: hypothetical protein U0Q15_06120 [Kineosporiaceae bacterium]
MAALPGRGLYARHLGHPEGVDGVHRVTVPAAAGVPARGPAVAAGFDSAWLRDHLDRVDVVHVHGLPPGSDPRALQEAVDVVRASGRPLVVTAYHLSDPVGARASGYDDGLDVLIPAADAVFTLTGSARAEMARRWDVDAGVLPHPHVVDFVRMRQHRAALRGPLLVGVHLGALRGPVPGDVMAQSLADAVSEVEGVRLLVQVNSSVLDSGSTTYAPTRMRKVREAVASVGGTLRVDRPLTESQLWDHLFALDVSVVPGMYGSHSVWPEACHDLGTQVVLPAGTHAEGQRPCHTFDMTEQGPDTATLTSAIKAAREQALAQHDLERAHLSLAGPRPETEPGDAPDAVEATSEGTLAPTPACPVAPWRADPALRWQERVTVAETLRATYERLTGIGAR